MIYLYGYLAIGAVVLAVLSVLRARSRDDQSESLRDLLDAVNPSRRRRSYRILHRLVIPALGTGVVLLIWPVAVYLRVTRVVSKKDSTGSNMNREFAVEPCHLQERLTVEEIEAREMVENPLGAVPHVPFGHLNAAWRTFLKSRANGDELWSFSARWRTWLHQPEVRSGYALVRNGTPVAHFLTVWKDLSEENESRWPPAGAT